MNTISREQAQIMFQKAQEKGIGRDVIFKEAINRGFEFEGLDTNKVKQELGMAIEKPKRNLAEKVLDFTGGKEIAQGLGQALAQRKTGKEIEELQRSQFDIQGNLLAKIKEKRTSGEDTSRLENALKMISEDITDTANRSEELLNPNKLTDKQVLGDALQLATTAGGAKVAGSVAGKITQTPGVIAGLAQGAKAGALSGATVGGLSGVSQGLQEDKDTIGVLKQGLSGAAIGGVLGGALGGITGAVSGGVKAGRLAKKEEYLNAVTPDPRDLTPTEYEELVSLGKIKPKTSTSPAQYILSKEEKQIASKYRNILSKDPVQNVDNIVSEIAKKDKKVGDFLKKNNGIYNTGELKNSLAKKLEGIDDLTIDEARLTKLKKSTIDNFVKGIEKNDMISLWKARKVFDRQIEKAFSGSPTLQNTIKKEFRNAVQEFIAERTSDGVYKAFMKEMSQLFNLKDIVLTKAGKEKGMNAIQLWIKRNPTQSKTAAWIAGTGLLGTIGASILKD